MIWSSVLPQPSKVSKSSLREKFRLLRNSIERKEQTQRQKKLDLQIKQFFSTATKGFWGGYWPQSQEVSLLSVMNELKKNGIEFCFPRINASSHNMDFHRITQEMESHPLGFLQPKASCPLMAKSEMEGFLLPLLAFDSRGTRLGQGKGYYDRYLNEYSGIIAGLAFSWQFSREILPKETHDKTLTHSITEEKIWNFTSS